MVSIVVPVYNVADYIDNCLQSVVGQTWEAFEVILIDDGSTDGSYGKCREWAKRDPRIRLVHKENEGLGPARNLGVAMAGHEYVTFLDADDWWDSRFLEELLKPVLDTAPDIVCCDIHYWEKDRDGKVTDSISRLRMEPGRKLPVSENRELVNTARTFAWGKVYKKSLFTENDILQPAHIYEDVAVVPYMIAKADSLYRVDQPLYYYYRKRYGSLANRADGLCDMKLSLQELIGRFQCAHLFGLYQQQLKKMVYSQARFVVNRAKNLCSEGEYHAVRQIYLEFLATHFPGTEKWWEAAFRVEGRVELKEALRRIVIDDGQIADYREFLGKGEEGGSQGGIIFEVPAAGRIFLALPSQEIWEHRKVQLEQSFFEGAVGEGQLWDMADEIFYTL